MCVMAETDANERLAFVEVGEMAQPLGHARTDHTTRAASRRFTSEREAFAVAVLSPSTVLQRS